MKPIDVLRLRAIEVRARLAEIATAELTDESRAEIETLKVEYRDNEARQAALIVAGDVPAEPIETADTSEGREYRELRSAASFSRYVSAAMAGKGVSDGPELELNRHLGIADNFFSLRMLAGDYETRAIRDVDAGANQGTWLDRVFSETAAQRLGISFRPVAPGVAAFPYTSAGGSPVQRGRTEAVTESTYTIVVTEAKPARRAVHGIYSIEDVMRLPGLADAIERDMRMAMTESVDLTVFNGDDGANEAGADITGLQTASITEKTLTQAHKVDAFQTIEEFADMVDGKHAMSAADLSIVASVGANKLWMATQANTNRNETVKQVMMGNGLNWFTRGGIETNSAAGDFGAYIGRQRGIDGSGIAAVWETAQLITDPYSGATTGEVQLTLNYLYQLVFPRTDSFLRLKFVA